MALEGHALFCDLAQRGQGEHLEAAAVGQDRTIPIHKAVQAACFLHQGFAGAQMQMIGIGQQNLRADLLHLAAGHGLDAGLRAHWHIDGRLNIAVGGMHHAQAGARFCVALFYFKG